MPYCACRGQVVVSRRIYCTAGSSEDAARCRGGEAPRGKSCDWTCDWMLDFRRGQTRRSEWAVESLEWEMVNRYAIVPIVQRVSVLMDIDSE